jgi:hypothetical protein
MFSSATALRNYIKETQGIPLENMETVRLDTDQKLLRTIDTKEALGLITTQYMGMRPGVGRVFSIIATLI